MIGKDHGRAQGFSLIELIISSALVLFLILGTGEIIIQSRMFIYRAERRLQCLELAFSKLGYFRSLSFDSGELKPGGGSELLETPGTAGTYELEWKVVEADLSAKVIDVACYPSGQPDWGTRLSLRLSRSLGF